MINHDIEYVIELIELIILDERDDFNINYYNKLKNIKLDNNIISDLILFLESTITFNNNEILNFISDSLRFHLKESGNLIDINNAINDSIDDFQTLLINKLKSNLNEQLINKLKNLYLFLLSIAYLNIFIISNWTGPQIGYISPSDQVILENEKFLKNNSKSDFLDRFLIFGTPNTQLRLINSNSLDILISNELGIDGEIIYDGVFGISYFYLARYIFNRISYTFSTSFIWSARFAYIHQSIIRNGYQNYCNSLAKMTIFDYAHTLKQLGILPNISFDYMESESQIDSKIQFDNHFKSLLLIELVKYLVTFGFYHYIPQVIEEATRLLGITIDFTGKMGIRRKYQKIPYPQLIVDIKSQSTASSILNDKNPTVLQLDDLDVDNDIYEIPILLDDENSLKLSVEEELLLLIKCLQLSLNITSDDEMGLEQLEVLSSKILYKSHNLSDDDKLGSCWSITTSALWFKLKTEHIKSSRVCRAAMQLDGLSMQFYDNKIASKYRLKYFHFVYYPSIWEIRREGAKRLFSIGSLISACDLYNELGMYEDSIICLTVSGRKHEAKKIVLDLLEKNEYPYLWCSLGDIDNSIEYYIKAWELSNNRYARAQRSLGSLYYNKKLFKESAISLELSLLINPLNKFSCYTLGCCYLQLNEYKKALDAFSKVLKLDPDIGEVWANMASAHLRLENYDQAKMALEEAIKRNRSSNKMWEMYLSTCLLIKDVVSVCNAIYNLCKLGCYDSIKPWIVAYILSNYDPNNSKIIIESIRNAFQVIINGCKDPDIWDLCCQYSLIDGDYPNVIEYLFKRYRIIYDNLISANYHLSEIAMTLLECLEKILEFKDRVDNSEVIFLNIKDNFNSLKKLIKNKEIESGEVDNAVDRLNRILNV